MKTKVRLVNYQSIIIILYQYFIILFLKMLFFIFNEKYKEYLFDKNVFKIKLAIISVSGTNNSSCKVYKKF